MKEDLDWSLFDPNDTPELVDLYGEAFETAYVEHEKNGLAKATMSARTIYSKMMKTLAQTGNGWMTFKDASNLKSNQTGQPQNVIHLSNLCTEILEVTNSEETAVCNLGSVNLGSYVINGKFDYEKLGENVRVAVKYLDRVVDINFYPINSAAGSNAKWRPIGLGAMGLQNAFFKLGLPFDSEEAQTLSARIAEEIYLNALTASCELAEEHGAHTNFGETRAANGDLQFDLWNVEPSQGDRWTALKEESLSTD